MPDPRHEGVDTAGSPHREGNPESSGTEKGKDKLFNRMGLVLFLAVIVLEAIGFGLVFLLGSSPEIPKVSADSLPLETDGSAEVSLDTLSQLEAHTVDLGEVTTYPKATQARAPRRITCELKMVLSPELWDQISSLGKDSDKEVSERITLNVRSFLNKLLEEYGLRIVDGTAKEAFEHDAKTRLNNGQVEGDKEMVKVLRILRGHVRQIIVNRLEQSNY